MTVRARRRALAMPTDHARKSAMGSLVRSALVALVLGVATPAHAQCPDGTPRPCGRPSVTAPRAVPPPAERAKRFLFLPLRNVTQRPAQEWLVTGGPLLLAENLSRYRELTVVSEDRLTAARRRLRISADSAPDATQLRRIAEETNAWTAVSGNILAAGPRVRISVQATDLVTGVISARAETEVPADENADVREAFAELGAKLLAATGVAGTASASAALSTQSLDAYRAYVDGMGLLRQSAFVRARAKFADAVRLDTAFALAWAKLAITSLGWDVEGLVNPAGPAYRAIEQAARYSSRLPAREAAHVRIAQAFLRGEISRARSSADSIAQLDSDDLEVLEMRAIMEMLDPVVVPGSTPPRLRVSYTRLVELVRELISRDPGRRYMYAVLAYAYATAAGLYGNAIAGVAAEGSSLGATMLAPRVGTFAVVLRDTLAMMPVADFLQIPFTARGTLQRTAAAAANTWVQRWLTIGADDADAHLWASRAAELLGDYPRALRELHIADSIGIESPIESVVGRRLALEVRAGNYRRAATLADSLSAGVVARQPFNSTLDRTRRSALAALLLDRRWAQALAVTENMPAPAGTNPACTWLSTELAFISDWSNPLTVRRAISDTVAMHFAEVSAVPALARCAENLVTGLYVDAGSSTRTHIGPALLRAADSLQRAGNPVVAYRAARATWLADTTQRAALRARPWFVERSKAHAVFANFSVTAAVVSGDSVAFTFRQIGNAPLEIDAPGLATNWVFSTRVTSVLADSVRFFVTVAHGAAPTERGMYGGAGDLVRAMTIRSATAVTPQRPLSAGTVTLAEEPGGFRLVIRGEMVPVWARRRPTVAELSVDPCIATTEGLCGQRTIAIAYR